MDSFTFIPQWVIQDLIILVMAVIFIFFIIRKEKHYIAVLLEFVCFIFLNAAVFENFATLMGWYGYGRSILMLFNVPLTVPILEYLVVYSSLRILENMNIKTWCKPFVVGVFGMLVDLSLDPLAVRQVFNTQEGTIGRWTWYFNSGSVNIYKIPVYNFSGWMLLCGYAAAMILLGRWWFKKSGYKKIVGYVYPVLAMLISLGILVTKYTSNFLLWLEPIMTKGSISEYIMMGFYFVFTAVLLLIFWRGRMLYNISFKEELPIFLIFFVSHASNILFALIGNYWEILWLQFLAAIIQSGLILFIYFRGKQFKTLNPSNKILLK
jgi:hypothetical protein